MCNLLDLTKMCLASSVAPGHMAKLDALVKTVAASFERQLPSTEQAIVMHMLFFHLPDSIRMWGPARGFWCFPFER